MSCLLGTPARCTVKRKGASPSAYTLIAEYSFQVVLLTCFLRLLGEKNSKNITTTQM